MQSLAVRQLFSLTDLYRCRSDVVYKSSDAEEEPESSHGKCILKLAFNMIGFFELDKLSKPRISKRKVRLKTQDVKLVGGWLIAAG